VAWIDGAYVVNAIGQTQAYRLGLISAPTGTYTDTSALTQYESEARGVVAAVLVFAGYPVPSAIAGTEDYAGLLRRLARAIMLRDVYAMRPGIAMPDATANMIGVAQGELNAVYEKRLPVPGLTPTAIAAIGGVSFSSASGTPFRSLRGSTF
jgi:hypothetical protein